MSKKTILVQETSITILRVANEDYISLTDMVKKFDDGLSLIEKWLRNKNSLEFLGIWERINNPNFDAAAYTEIMMDAGLNRFTISVKRWVDRTGAIGLLSRSGRHDGGTFAQKDIAFEFGAWLSPEFKLYMIKEFQRMKQAEESPANKQWLVSRALAKINYRIHTDAIKEHLVPAELSSKQTVFIFASEADLLNVAVFGVTAGQWRKANPGLNGNIRDHAAMEQLVVLANLESLNANLIEQGMPPRQRLIELNKTAIRQMRALISHGIDSDHLLR